MERRDCTGRKISLLNTDSGDISGAYPSKCPLPPIATSQSHYSHTPSTCSSTPSLSPESESPRSFPSPSPLTPALNQLPHAHPRNQQYFLHRNAFTKMDDQNASMYPPLPDATAVMASAYPIPPHLQMPPNGLPQPLQQVSYRTTSTSPVSEPSHVSSVSTALTNKGQGKKNQYPCPLAKQIGCNDFFTTSGHAARHAKKHTGKKDAFCPECNKAFTRKDNMEQHRRTHQNGRGAPRSNNGDASKVKKPAAKSTSRKTDIKSEPQFEAAVEQQLAEEQMAEQMVEQQQQQEQLAMQVQTSTVQMPQSIAMQQALMDQSLMLPPTGPYFIGNGMDAVPVPALPLAMPELSGRPPLLRNNFTTSLEYAPPAAPMVADPDALHYSYPSPGLSNGLNSLALAASEHRRLSQGRSSSSNSPQESPYQETP